MRHLVDPIIDGARDAPVALARVVATHGSSPRATGAAMMMTADGTVHGSLSGGCVDAAVIDTAHHVVGSGKASSEVFGTDDGLGVGLTCGGEIEVFVERVDHHHLDQLQKLRQALADNEPVALATILSECPQWNVITATGHTRPWHDLDRDAHAALEAGISTVIGSPDCDRDTLAGPATRPRTFVHVFAPPPRMILAGSNDFTQALAMAAAQLGYRVTVVDARSVFATPARFPTAEVIVDWPHRYLAAERAAGRLDRRTVMIVMTHDAKFDVPALATVLGDNPIAFVGAMGSRHTTDDRRVRLREEGVSEAGLARLHAPVGLDLQAHTPQETAISVLAEVIAHRRQGSGRPLRDLDGALHAAVTRRP